MSPTNATPSAPASSSKIADSAPASSSIEPSPASTYGGSVASDAGYEAPQTPVDGADSLLGKLNKITIEIKENKVPVAIYSPPFVRNGAQSGIEDPFTSPAGRASGQRTPTGPKKSKAVSSDNWRSGSSAGSNSSPSSPSAGRGSGQRDHSFAAHDCDTNPTSLPAIHHGAAIQSEDAQAIYPPSSCAFVANLLQSESDEALEVAVTRVFREFGTVFVKIRRDMKHMPFAFCQYTTDLAAENAIRLGRGRMICGRPCRVEKAKAHRLFYFERKYGSAVSREEAGQLLRRYGRIESIKFPSDMERAAYNLNEGVVVQFQMYDEGQAALQAFRSHDVYKMQSMANMTSSRGTPARMSDPANRLYLATYELDRRSIFVGSLPADIEEAELEDIFKTCGQVIHITIHKPESIIDASQKHCFAFIEFINYHMATRAIDEMNNTVLRGKTLKVSQKDTEGAKSRNNVRRQVIRASPVASAGSGTYSSPTVARISAPEQASPSAYMFPGYGAYSPYHQSQWGMYGGQSQFYPITADYSGYYSAGAQTYPGNYSGNYPGSNYPVAYSGSPSYPSCASMTATAGSPAHSSYGYYQSPGYQAAPVYYNSAAYYSTPAYTQPAPTNSTAEEVRSATPTPVGNVAADETPSQSE